MWTVEEWWSSYHFEGSSNILFAHKLKALKADLKVWNEQVFGNLENQKKNLLGELIVLDGLGKERVLRNKEKRRKDSVIIIGELEREPC